MNPGTDLIIYYVLSHGAFGEAWTKYSWLQFSGMLLLFFGTAGPYTQCLFVDAVELVC